MKDLLAVVTVRRLLLELGHALPPEGGAGVVGPLSLWVNRSFAELDGLTPLQVLGAPNGEIRLRGLLAELMASGKWPAAPTTSRDC